MLGPIHGCLAAKEIGVVFTSFTLAKEMVSKSSLLSRISATWVASLRLVLPFSRCSSSLATSGFEPPNSWHRSRAPSRNGVLLPIYASWCGWSSHWPASPGHQSPLDSSRFGHLIHCVPFYAGWTHEVIAAPILLVLILSHGSSGHHPSGLVRLALRHQRLSLHGFGASHFLATFTEVTKYKPRNEFEMASI
jgi:hypothetical protein